MRHVAMVCMVIAMACGSEREPRENPLAATARLCVGHSELECPRPILNVKSLREAQKHYRDALGFKVDWDYGDPPDFGSVSRSDVVLFMCQNCQGARGSWVFTFTRDVDKLHKEFVGRKAIIQMPPTNQPWGLREMQVADPDGNVLRFAAPIEHD
jgi:catechol 2,3-dioxygenase-like lactoylglutathione lyase family enzyme